MIDFWWWGRRFGKTFCLVCCCAHVPRFSPSKCSQWHHPRNFLLLSLILNNQAKTRMNIMYWICNHEFPTCTRILRWIQQQRKKNFCSDPKEEFFNFFSSTFLEPFAPSAMLEMLGQYLSWKVHCLHGKLVENFRLDVNKSEDICRKFSQSLNHTS